MAWTPVLKRHDAPAALQKPVAAWYVGYVGELILRDIQQLCKFYPVRRRLVEHNEKLAIGQHRAGRVALE